jgi:hypothetical protein
MIVVLTTKSKSDLEVYDNEGTIWAFHLRISKSSVVCITTSEVAHSLVLLGFASSRSGIWQHK